MNSRLNKLPESSNITYLNWLRDVIISDTVSSFRFLGRECSLPFFKQFVYIYILGFGFSFLVLIFKVEQTHILKD